MGETFEVFEDSMAEWGFPIRKAKGRKNSHIARISDLLSGYLSSVIYLKGKPKLEIGLTRYPIELPFT